MRGEALRVQRFSPGFPMRFEALAALGATRSLSTMLYQVAPNDPPTFIGVAILFAGVAAAACYVPARRAARVDPLVALRYE